MEKTFKLIDKSRETVIEWQKNLVAIKALGPENDGEGEFEKARYIKKLLQEIGFDDIKQIDAPDDRVPSGIRPNLIATLYGADRSRTLWIMAHMDVVPEGDLEKWDSDPFSLRVDGDAIYGRGVEDNHQGLVSGLLAVKAIKESGAVPKMNVSLAIVADEETGSHFGLEYLLKTHPELFGKEDLIIVPDAGDPKGKSIEVSEKSILWIKFVIAGKQCHASTPQFGINAHRAAAHLAVELDKLYELYPEKDELYDTPSSTFEPTKKQANVPNINTIPGEDTFYLDCRVLPVYPLDHLENTIRKITDEIARKFRVTIELSFPQREEAAPPTPADAPVVTMLSAAIRTVKGQEPEIIGIGGGTVAAFFRRAGHQAVVWSTIEDTCHQPNEVSLISSTLDDAKIFAACML